MAAEVLHRRRFLQAMVAGVTGSNVILKATPEEVLQFGVQKGQTLVSIPPMQMWRNFPDYNLLPAFQKVGTLLYNAQGQPIAAVTRFAVKHPDWETNPWDDRGDGTVPNPERIQVHICAEGLPEIISGS